jgi:hypothetical protein
LVEGAMVMSLFVLLAAAVVEFGHLMHQEQALAERTRAAVRAGAVRSLTPEQVAAMVVFGEPQPPEGTAAGFQGLRLADVNVRILDRGTDDQRIAVTVRAPRRRTVTPFLAFTPSVIELRMSSPMESP